MKEKLASSMTFYYKVLFPFLWFTGFGAGTIAMWLGRLNQASQSSDDPRLIILVAWIAVSLFLLTYTICLKVVSLDKDVLVIKDFRESN